MFCSTLGQVRERKEKEVGSSSLPNTFDDDCRYRNSETTQHTHTHNHVNRGYYMAARGYEFYLRVLKVSLTISHFIDTDEIPT